jgi:hypothetical protein
MLETGSHVAESSGHGGTAMGNGAKGRTALARARTYDLSRWARLRLPSFGAGPGLGSGLRGIRSGSHVPTKFTRRVQPIPGC